MGKERQQRFAVGEYLHDAGMQDRRSNAHTPGSTVTQMQVGMKG